jgi:hypothetical protein
MLPFLIIDPYFDVYDTTLPTNRLPDKSIQILTVSMNNLMKLRGVA